MPMDRNASCSQTARKKGSLNKLKDAIHLRKKNIQTPILVGVIL